MAGRNDPVADAISDAIESGAGSEVDNEDGSPDGGNAGGFTGLGDMIDGGGPGAAGPIGRAVRDGLGNAFETVTGGYTSVRDMFDGGGAGQSGDTFGGLVGGISNAVGLSPDTFSGSGMQRDTAGFSPSRFADSPNDAWEGRSAQTNTPNNTTSFSPGSTSQTIPPQVQRWLNTKNTFATLSDWVSAFPVSFGSAFDYLTGDDVSRFNRERSQVPEFEQGGYVGPGGMPIRPQVSPEAMSAGLNAGQQQGLSFPQIEQQVQQFVQTQPQIVRQIQQQVQQGMMAGEVTPEALNMFVQVATVALQNPEMWPQLRQSLITQGFLDAQDISAEYDQGFLITLYIMGKSVGDMLQSRAPQQAPQGQMPAPQGPAPMQPGVQPMASMREGGPLPHDSPNPDGSIPIEAHEGEYVVPADVVRRLGTQHFDKLIEKTRNPPEQKPKQGMQ